MKEDKNKIEMKSEIRSTLGEIVHFKKSLLAKEIRRELLRWARDIKEMYPSAETLLEKGRIDGRLEGVLYVLGIVDEMETNKREELENDSRCDKTG